MRDDGISSVRADMLDDGRAELGNRARLRAFYDLDHAELFDRRSGLVVRISNQQPVGLASAVRLVVCV